MTGLRVVVVVGCSVGAGLAGVRWLRVAQREHYLPGGVTRFAVRWWGQDGLSIVSVGVAIAGVVLAGRWPVAGLSTGVVAATGPGGLGLRGRTSPLAWTRRLRTLAGVGVGLGTIAVVLGVLAGVGPAVAAGVCLLAPFLVDLGTAITGPVERAVAHRYVSRAAGRIERVGPTVVAITGSYGKTSTKGYVAHLVAGSKVVVASPASFNNRAGLARAVNENLTEGTEVFLAEMGTYGPGEIAELTSWLPPDISVITAIGPVHLERFGTEERILAAKAEILEKARTVVLNVGDPRLAALADRAEASGQRVRRVSALSSDGPDTDTRPASGSGLDVGVGEDAEGLRVVVEGTEVARRGRGPQPGNVAVAVAVALELGVSPEEIASRIGSLPSVAHRLESTRAEGGFVVLDDTYNANPAGARAALSALGREGAPSGRRVVVTPGMVELGRDQFAENAAFAAAAASVADDLLVVGRTNRSALLAGARTVGEGGGAGGEKGPREGGAAGGEEGGRGLRTVVVDRRDEAVAWVRQHLGPGDVVLYENDLPDHFP